MNVDVGFEYIARGLAYLGIRDRKITIHCTKEEHLEIAKILHILKSEKELQIEGMEGIVFYGTRVIFDK